MSVLLSAGLSPTRAVFLGACLAFLALLVLYCIGVWGVRVSHALPHVDGARCLAYFFLFMHANSPQIISFRRRESRGSVRVMLKSCES